jgi:GLPGLI family protein
MIPFNSLSRPFPASLATWVLSALIATAATQTARAQAPAAAPSSPSVKTGKVLYERKVNMHRRMTDENMKNMIPEFATNKAELIFTGDESTYQNVKEDDDIRDQAAGENGNGNRIIMKIGGGEACTYRNYATGQMTEQRQMGPKKYLIQDTLRQISWKLQEDTMTITGYTCKKATAKDRQGNPVIAWYTEDIPASSGPETFGGLPGLILSLDVNNAEVRYTPISITPGDPSKNIVKAPTDGKKITRKEFQQMMEEQYGVKPGEGGMQVRIFHNGN